MTAPFTPFESFTDDATPAIDAEFLNAIQLQGIGPAAAVAWGTVPMMYAYCTDGANVRIGAISGVMVKDSATSNYGFATMAAGTATAAQYVDNPGTFPTAWVYAYLLTTNGVPSIELTRTAPTADLLTKTGDTTRRYLFSFHCTSGSVDSFLRNGRKTMLGTLGYVFGSDLAVANFTTAVISHDLTGVVPPIAQTVDCFIFAQPTSSPYVLSIAGSQLYMFKWAVTTQGAMLTFPFSINGQGTSQQLASFVTDQTSSQGVIRVLQWTE